MLKQKNDEYFKIIDGRVAFSSSTAYQFFLSDKSNLSHLKDLGSLGFKSLSSKLKLSGNDNFGLNTLINGGNDSINQEIEDLLDENSILGNIINTDGVFQIGSYIINIDFYRDTCFVLHSANFTNLNYTDLLSGNLNNTAIMSFSNEDEVLEILADHGNPTIAPVGGWYNGDFGIYKKKCGGGASRKKDEGHDYSSHTSGNQYRLWNKVVYQKAGVYFSLVLKSKHYVGPRVWTAQECQYIGAINMNIKYKEKCQSEIILGVHEYIFYSSESVGDPIGVFVYRPFESSRALNKYEISCQFQSGMPWDYYGTPTAFITTREFGIKDGY